MAEIEKLVQGRTRTILAMAIAFALWQGGDIVAQMVMASSSLFVYASVAKILGAIAYALSALFLFLFHQRVRKAKAAAILQDDWNRLTAARAIQCGFFFLIGATLLMYMVSMFWPLPAMITLQGLILVGVTGTLTAFVVLESKGDCVK